MVDGTYYLKGTIAGIVGSFLSHPIDTIKTNVQTGLKVDYNIRSLYRGFTPVLLGVGAEKTVTFGTYLNMKLFLQKSYPDNPMLNTAISGGAAGFCASIIVAPVDRFKILCQTKDEKKRLSKEKFNPKQIFKGLSATFTREVPGYITYFSVYELIENKFYNGKHTKVGAFFSGGLCGAAAWLIIFPQDKIKTIIQSDIGGNKSFFQIGKYIYMNEGFLGFFRGIHLPLLRAVPLHSGAFGTMRLLENINLSL